MTILENNVTPARNKLSLKRDDQLKRKYSFDNSNLPVKKQHLGDMLNGYRNDQKSNGDALHDSPVATLSNMGNTCFLNSVLYTLRFAPTFLHNLHHLIGDLALVNTRLAQNKTKTSSLGRNISSITGPSSRSTSSKDLLTLGTSYDLPKSKVQIVTEKLHDLFITMHNLEMKESTDPYQPVAFLQAVREANYIFEGNHQQDAHELLVYLLDNIRETCELLSKQVLHNPDLLNDNDTTLSSSNNSKLKSVRQSLKKTYKKKDKSTKESIGEEHNNETHSVTTEDTSSVESNCENIGKRIVYNFVAEDFEGITLRRTKCLECESITERKEPFYDIPVPISLKENDDDNNLIDPNEFYRKACVTSEKLCDTNKYLCETCKRYNEASRDVLFEKLPNIMVLQLKRFKTTIAGVQKVNTYLPTPLELKCFCETCCKIDNNDTPPHRYQLCCVIMHLGGTMASGHYITYVKASDHFEDYAECSRDIPKPSLSASSSEKSLTNNFFKMLKTRILVNSFVDNIISSKSVMNDVRLCKSIDCCGVKLNKNVVENVINSCSSKKNLINNITTNGITNNITNTPNTTNISINTTITDTITEADTITTTTATDTTNTINTTSSTTNIISNNTTTNANTTPNNNNNINYSTGASVFEDMWLECDDENVRPITSQEFEEDLSFKPNSTSTPYLLFYSKITDLPLD